MRTQTAALRNKKRPMSGKTNGNLKILSTRLSRLENEIAVMRRELSKALPPGDAPKPDELKQDIFAGLRADKTLLRQAFNQLFEQLSIVGEPIPAEELQKRMGELGLEPNEISQAITAAREE